MEVQFRATYDAIFERFVTAGTHYLDAGCGSGLAAMMAADRGAIVSGIDAAEPLLAIARERVPGGDFRVGDLETLPFGNGAFELVTGFNSFQYAGDPVAALVEARRVSKPSGCVVIMTWGPPEQMQAAALVKALGPLLPPPPPGAPGPFALSDENTLKALAEKAGLSPREILDVDSAFEYPDLATGVRALNSAGVAVRAAEHSGQAAVTAAHEKALAPFRKPDGSYAATAIFRCLICEP
jgi:SAM-dependent methyltransferase